MADLETVHATIDHTGITGVGPASDILDLSTAETDDTLVLAPDGAGGVEFRAEAGGGGGGTASPFIWHSDNAPASPDSRNREFTSALADTRVANGTPRGTWAQEHDGAQFTHTVTGGTELDAWAISGTVNVGDYATIYAVIPNWQPDYLGPFVGFANGTIYGTSNAIGSTIHPLSGDVQYNTLLNSYPGFNSRGSDGTVVAAGTMGTTPMGIRVKYEAANTWGLYLWLPGGGWRTIQSNYSYTMTPTHVVYGVCMLTPTFTAGLGAGVRLESFRVND